MRLINVSLRFYRQQLQRYGLSKRFASTTTTSQLHRTSFKDINFITTLGGRLKDIHITWEQWGDTSLPANRTIVILPSFSHGSHAAASLDDPSPGWWDSMIGPGKYINTNYWRIISPSFLGSPFGSTSPLSLSSEGTPMGPEFPLITPLDMARVHAMFLGSLGLNQVHAIIGSSLGAMQAIQLLVHFPLLAARAICISGTAKTTPYTVAMRHLQRRAITSDPDFMNGWYFLHDKLPKQGLRLAREIGMTLYRSREEFDARFDWRATGTLSKAYEPQNESEPLYEVQSYLLYQGRKFSTAYDANCYLLLSQAMDLQDVAQPLGPIACNAVSQDTKKHLKSLGVQNDSYHPPKTYSEALKRIRSDSLLIAADNDALIPFTELEQLHKTLSGDSIYHDAQTPNITFELLRSRFGHDAFLHDFQDLGPMVQNQLEKDLVDVLTWESRHTTGLSAP